MPFTQYAERIADLLKEIDDQEVENMIEAITEAYINDKMVFLIGNGGSGANASHFCEDLGKGTLCDFEYQKRLKVMSLTDNTPYILAWANDTSYDRIFSEQLRNFASSGDLLIAISGSGNSPNIITAIEYAKSIGMKTFGMTGYDGGKLRQMADQCLHVPKNHMGDVESIHGVCIHYILEALYDRFTEMHQS
jgi:D-sedoheptulose 7-phosphate isomerase